MAGVCPGHLPDWKGLIREQLASLNLATAREAEIVEEFAQHAEDRYQELMSGGTPDAEARWIAIEEISDGELLAAEMRAVEPAKTPEPAREGAGLVRDVRFGIRSLRKSLGLTLVVIAVLGLGIGATVAMFTVVDAAFLRPLRLPEPERVVQVMESPPSCGFMPVSYPDFVDWEKQSQSFESMGIAGIFQETLKRAGGNERIQVGYVSPGFHRAYGIQPAVGRLLLADDDRASAQPVVLLSHAFWQSQFAGDRGVIGRTLIIGEDALTVVGVTAPFRWHRTADVFVPIALAHRELGLNIREQHSGTGVTARLKPGVTIEQARAEMKTVAAGLAKQYPGSNGGISAVVVPLREFIGGNMREPVLLMFGAVGLLLLVACAKVAGLLLARAAVRRREMAIRTALGASRSQLIRQLLTESLLLALAGAAAGLVVARVSLAGLQRIFPSAENLGGIGIDARVLAFSVLAAVATALLSGVAPAIQFTRYDMADAIRAGPGLVPTATKAAVTPGYFRAMGIPLLRGRLLTASADQMPRLKNDIASLLEYLRSAELVAVINDTMARRFWPGEDPIGRSFRFGIGVRMALGAGAGDVRKMVVREGEILAALGLSWGSSPHLPERASSPVCVVIP